MKNVRILISKLVVTATLFFASLAFQPVQAQISYDDDVDDSTPAAPIDGLLGLGLVAGAFYGIRKLKGKK